MVASIFFATSMPGKLCEADEQNLYSHMQTECNKFIQEKLQSRMKVPPQYHIRHEDNGFILHEYTGTNVYQLCAQFRVSAELSEVAQLLASPSTSEFRNWMGFWHDKGFIDGAVLHESDAPPLDPAGHLEKLCVKYSALKHGMRGVRDMIFADYSVLQPTIASDDPMFAQFQLSLEKMPNPSLMELETHYNTQKFKAERLIVEPSGFLVQPVKNNPSQLQIMCYMSWNRHAGVTAGFKNHLQHVMQGLDQLHRAIISLRLNCITFVKPKDWIDDRFRKNCGVCDQTFSALKRKHHCRVCGDVVCSRCSLIVSAALPTIGMTKVRSCKICISKPIGSDDNDDIISERGSWIENMVVKQMTGRDSSENLKPLPADLVPENELARLEALDSYEILQEDDSNTTFEF